MFKQLLLRSNRALSVVWDVSVNLHPKPLLICKRGKSSEELRQVLADTFSFIVRQTKMDIDEKMKELADLFAKTGKELSELVKKNEQFITNELRRVEEAVRAATEVCGKDKLERLRRVKDDYAERIKVCNEKASAGFQAAKVQCDQRIREADSLRDSMKQILKECLETNEFVKCVGSEAKEAVRRQRQISEELKDTVKSAETSVLEQLKEATKCHADAQAEALKSLHKILKDTKDCL